MNDSFVVFNEHMCGIEELSWEQRGKLFTALLAWNGACECRGAVKMRMAKLADRMARLLDECATIADLLVPTGPR